MSLPANSKLSCDPAVIAALGLPPGDWIFSDASDSYVLALPAGTFFPASNFRGKGFVLMPGKPPEPDSCCNFFDGGEMSGEERLELVGFQGPQHDGRRWRTWRSDFRRRSVEESP